MIRQFINSVTAGVLLALSGAGLAGCGMVNDDLEPCTVTYNMRFVYDYNMLYADAFPSSNASVYVWGFDSEGHLALTASETHDALAQKDFTMPLEIAPGTYEFVAWCGLVSNGPFDLATYAPASKQELEVTLSTMTGSDGIRYSDTDLPALYHGYLEPTKFTSNPTAHVNQTVTMRLMKDTKVVRVMLQHLDGSPIERRDFSTYITDNNAHLSWDNDVIPGDPFQYRPWFVNYGQVVMPDNPSARATTSVATLLFELTTSRLMADHEPVLTIHRDWDNRDVVRIPLIDYLLLVKGHYNESMSDQEYLDRMDEFNIVFFIDANSNWYTAAGILINNWTVVPPQEEGI